MTDRPNRKVLVVDDNFDMRMIIRLTLERSGWLVIDAEEGQDAIQKTRAEMPDVIVMDYNMPLMDGVTACGHITSTPELAHIPILIYTGAYTEHTRNLAMQAGAFDFMSKPLLPAEIRNKVENAYKKSQSQLRD